MNISIFGLGYVGCVSAGCLSKNEHNVVGVDVNEEKIRLINSGYPTIIEDKISEMVRDAVKAGHLTATMDAIKAVTETDVSIICVGTPNSDNGHLNLEQIFSTASSIAEALKKKDSFHIVVIRSTVSPGTNKNVSNIISEVTGKKENEDFAVVSNPEFLREGSAVNDYYNPPYTVIGTESDKAFEILKELYKNINAPLIRTDIGAAEMIKYVNNSFHALKIAFANEVGNICNAIGINANELMNLFVKDTKLNISPAYLKPGTAYGGSCLPKDLLGLNSIAHDNYVDVPILSSIKKSNDIQKQIALTLILKQRKTRIGIIGLAFKSGTDDLRNSPAVELAENLIGKGFRVKIFDKNVSVSKLIGKNKSYVEEKLPHLAELLSDNLTDVINNSDVIVINQDIKELKECNKIDDKTVIDLSGRINK